MNFSAPNQFSEFNCVFCHYRSGLDLKECPECGRLSRDKRSSAGETRPIAAPPFQNQSPLEFNAVAPSAPAAAETFAYECAHCRYQTSNNLAECPECGRRKFKQISVPFAANAENNHRYKKSGIDNAQAGRILLITSIGFFWLAFLVFAGYGPSGSPRRTAIVAAVGENAVGAALLALVGVVFIVAGIILKNKD
jgi:RNA polymerase subunit RPABC4/transcription elongation factor Spt4